MLLARALVFLLLLASAGCFAMFALTSEPRYKRIGWTILKWTLLAAFGFFAVLIVDRML